MNRYQKLFKYLYKNKLGAFVPFITIGDPNPYIFMNIIDTLIQSGSDALELGIPFSDPISDGPSIQKSIQRAFRSGISISYCFKLLQDIRNKYPNIPIGLLVYANLVFKNEINNFYHNCKKIDIDSILIPDLPIEESLLFYQASVRHQISHIFICPPNATIELIKSINSKSNGYIYLVSRPGITGITKTTFNTTILQMLIQNIKQQKKRMLPILQGFGIYTPSQAKESLLSGTSGIIMGSAIADIIEKYYFNINLLLMKLRKLTHLMKISMQLKNKLYAKINSNK